MLITKRCLSVVFVLTFWFFVIYGIYSIIDWGMDKHKENQRQRQGVFLTDALNTRENNGKVEIYNKESRKAMGSYDMVFAQDYGNSICEIFVNSQAGSVLVRDEGLYGFIDQVTGEVIMEPQFIMAWESDPASGLAACINDELKLGFVNIETQQMAIPFQFDIDSAYLDPIGHDDMNFFDFVFCNGLSLVPGPNGKVGIINEVGEVVVPIEYTDMEIKGYGFLGHMWEDLWYSETMSDVAHRNYRNNYNFENPVILIKSDSSDVARYGVFDRNGIVNIPAEFDQIAFVESGEKAQLICQKGGILRGVDKKGEFLQDFCFMDDSYYADGARVLLDPEEKPTPYIQYKTLDGYAVMDTDFRIVIEPDDFWDIDYLGNGLFACGRNDEYSIIFKDEKYNQLK